MPVSLQQTAHGLWNTKNRTEHNQFNDKVKNERGNLLSELEASVGSCHQNWL
jgi:hypothetical protein